MAEFTHSEFPVRLPVVPSDEQLFLEEAITRKFVAPKRKDASIYYEFTRDPGLLQQYYQLREEMFISVWGLEHFNGKKDGFDDKSHILVARQGLHCIAGGRLTVSTPDEPLLLPMEGDDLLLQTLFPELDLHETSYGEFSRLAILPEFRAGVVFPEISKRFVSRAVAEGVEYAFNIAPLPLALSYRQCVQALGVAWNICHHLPLPDREEYEGIQMVISVMDLTKFAPKRTQRSAVISEKETPLL